MLVIMAPNKPQKTFAEVVEAARKAPAEWSAATPALGSPGHLATIAFANLAGFTPQIIPYRGTAPALNDLIAGQVDLMFVDLTAVLPLWRAGRARVLAIASRQRQTDLPDVPTFEQIGVAGLFSAAWNAIAAPPKTPASITSRLNTEINAILNLPEVEAHFRALQLTRVGGSRADMAEFVGAERQRWEDVVRTANVTLE
jgi:tripartite-type tricarboxylate transporter receptor subunit TctC